MWERTADVAQKSTKKFSSFLVLVAIVLWTLTFPF